VTIKFRVDLSQEELARVQAMLKGGRHAAREIKRADSDLIAPPIPI
jgi:hypothetical protein